MSFLNLIRYRIILDLIYEPLIIKGIKININN